jgi:hypothetical protein
VAKFVWDGCLASKEVRVEKQKEPIIVRTRAEEMEILKLLGERIRSDRAFGLAIAQRAGILDENGELTEYYRQKE